MKKLSLNYLLLFILDIFWFSSIFILILSILNYVNNVKYMLLIAIGYLSAHMSLKINQKLREKKRKSFFFSTFVGITAIISFFIILNFYKVEFIQIQKDILYFSIPFMIFILAEYLYYTNKYYRI